MWNKEQWLKIVGSEPTTLDELFEGVKLVIVDRLKQRKSSAMLHGFAWDIRYSGTVSNTHSCPLDGETNWGGYKADVPRGYMGFCGRVWIRFSGDPGGWSSDYISATGTHTGTGGFGGYQGPWEAVYKDYFKKHGHFASREIYPLSWDYRFYLSDWPGLVKSISHSRLLYKIKDEKFTMVHRKEWTHPCAIENDSELNSELFLRNV